MNDINFPKIIHWHICSHCQLNCLFCYAIPGGRKKLSNSDYREIVKKIAEAGVKAVIFTGGEPLLCPDIVDLIALCKKQALFTAMDTNGILLTRKLVSKLDGILDRIGIPLDGSSPKIHDTLRRRRGHFQEMINVLHLLKNSKMKVKINTVVNKVNLEDVENIGKVIADISLQNLSLWSLYQFYPLAKGYNNRKLFRVTKDEFGKAIKRIKIKYPQLAIEGVPYSTRKGTYFAISSSGFVYTTPLDMKGKHIFLGDILKSNFVELWDTRFIDKEGYKERYAIQLSLFT